MSKLLFYLGIICLGFLALLTGVQAVQTAYAPSSMSGFESLTLQSSRISNFGSLFFSLVVVMAVAGLFVRMASLLAARDLFTAFFAALAAGCTAFAGMMVSAIQFRISAVLQSPDTAVLRALEEMHLAAVYAVGCFLSITLFVFRTYFKVHSSRMLTVLSIIPAPLFALIVAFEYGGVRVSQTDFSPLFLATVSMTFVAIAFHSLRHRHLFLEITNLRELLDARVDPLSRPRPARGLRLGNDVAFDS